MAENLEKKLFVDMHMHTIYSDGTNLPEQNIKDAALLGTEVVAITDHDITSSYDAAKKAADRFGIRLLTGVEVSTENYHILGYDFNIENLGFQNFLAYSRSCQEKIASKRIDMLNETGIPITLADVKTYFPNSRLGKYNICMTMFHDPKLREYNNGSAKAFFDAYLHKGASRMNCQEATTKDAIDEIHNAGGIAILAHPFKQITDITQLDELARLGIDGLEVQPNYGDKNIAFIDYAKQNNLLMTFGSDYHGAIFPNRPMLQRGYNFIETTEGKLWKTPIMECLR